MSLWSRLGFGEAQEPICPADDASGAGKVIAVTVADLGLAARLRVLASGRVMFVAKVYLDGPTDDVTIRSTYPAVSVLPPKRASRTPARLVDRAAP